MRKSSFHDTCLVMACILAPTLAFLHMWRVLLYQSPSQQAIDHTRIEYERQISSKYEAYTRLAHPAKINELASLKQKHAMLDDRLSSLQDEFPGTVAGALMARRTKQIRDLLGQIHARTHEMNQSFLTSEIQALKSSLTAMPQIMAQYETALNDLNQAAALYHSLSMEHETK